MRKRIETIKGSNQREILMDITFPEKSNDKLVVFSHGFKGFKDWGCFDLIAQNFAQNGFTFLKFNFSHNGGTIENPIDFPDEDAFGENTYSLEIEDLDRVLNFVENSFNLASVFLIGHSRGGGIATLKTGQDKRISKLATWAAVSDFKIKELEFILSSSIF